MLPSPSKKSWFEGVRPWLAALIFLFSFGYRLLGISWGAPNGLHYESYHPDEDVIWSYSRGVEPAHLKFTPGVYNYGTLYLTVLRIGSDVVSTYGGAPKDRDRRTLGAAIAGQQMFGRIVSALAGAGTAVVLFLMLRRYTRVFGAFFGGMVIGIAPAFVVHSRFQTVDVLATFLLALSLLWSTRLLPGNDGGPESERWRTLGVRFAALAGAFAGLSAGTKYTGIIAILSLIAAVFLSGRKNKFELCAVGFLSAFAGFVISTPGVLLDSQRFWRSFKYEMVHTSTGHDLLFVNVGSGFIYHLRNLIEGLGPALLIVSLFGLGVAAYRRHKWILVLLCFAVPYYILIGRAEVLFIRYTFPLYITLAVGFGYLMGRAHERQGPYRFAVMAGILSLGLSFIQSWTMTSWMMSVDPRDEAALRLKGLAGSTPNMTVGLVSDPWYYTPPLVPDTAVMRNNLQLAYSEMQASHHPGVVQYLADDRHDWDTRLITEAKPDYIVFSSFEVGDLWRLRDATNLLPQDKLRVDRFKEFEALLEAGYETDDKADPKVRYDDATALVHDLEYIRPQIWIWKRKS